MTSSPDSALAIARQVRDAFKAHSAPWSSANTIVEEIERLGASDPGTRAGGWRPFTPAEWRGAASGECLIHDGTRYFTTTDPGSLPPENDYGGWLCCRIEPLPLPPDMSAPQGEGEVDYVEISGPGLDAHLARKETGLASPHPLSGERKSLDGKLAGPIDFPPEVLARDAAIDVAFQPAQFPPGSDEARWTETLNDPEFKRRIRAEHEDLFAPPQPGVNLDGSPRRETEGLLPCPFCGGEAQAFYLNEYGYKRFRVNCAECLAATANSDNPTEARKDWNRRAAPASPRPVADAGLREALAKNTSIGHHDSDRDHDLTLSFRTWDDKWAAFMAIAHPLSAPQPQAVLTAGAPAREDAQPIMRVLQLIAEGYRVRGQDDRFVIVENPDYRPDNGSDPVVCIDMYALSSATTAKLPGVGK